MTVTDMTKGTQPNPTLSKDAKDDLKTDIKTIAEGAIDLKSIEVLPQTVHTTSDYQQIADVIRGGQGWVIEYRASRNTIYRIRKHLADKDAPWNTEPDPKDGTKHVPRKDAIVNVGFGNVKGSKNTVLYLR